jgi:hypothetical protein
MNKHDFKVYHSSVSESAGNKMILYCFQRPPPPGDPPQQPTSSLAPIRTVVTQGGLLLLILLLLQDTGECIFRVIAFCLFLGSKI